LDRCLVLWAISDSIVFTLLWQDTAAFVNRLGFLYTTFGAYFLLRHLLRDRDDLIRTVRVLAVLAAVISAFMLIESFTGKNYFSLLGGLPEASVVRNGGIRAGGPFAHPIIAGTFGAALLPVFIGLGWERPRDRGFSAIGIMASTIITITSASSTPLMVYATGIAGLCLWPFRHHMRIIRWGLSLSILAFHLAMRAPVWFLLQKMGEATGGSGWHRAALIDTFVRRFNEWWLIGTRNNANWGYDMWDAINGYVNSGTEGGLITLIFYIACFVYGYKAIGQAVAAAEKPPCRSASLIWMLGVSLASNTVAFLGITYFDQSILYWYTLLAMISAASLLIGKEKVALARADEPSRTPPPELLPIGPRLERLESFE